MARARSFGRHGHFLIVVGLVAAWKSVTSASFLSFVSVLTGSTPTSPGSVGASSTSSQAARLRHQSLRLRASEVAIEWLEPLDPNVKELEPSGDDGTMVLPVFPLGGPFMPYSKQKLNIFEPRSLDRKIWDNHGQSWTISLSISIAFRVSKGTDMINHVNSCKIILLSTPGTSSARQLYAHHYLLCSEIVKLG